MNQKPGAGTGKPQAADRGGGYLRFRNLETAARCERAFQSDIWKGEYPDLSGSSVSGPLFGTFYFNNAYYSAPRPNDQVLVFSFFRFGMVWLGVFVLLAVLNAMVQKGYRRELA